MQSLQKDLEAIDPQKRIKQLEKLLSDQQALIDRLRSAKFTLPVSRKKKCNGTYIRIIVPDSHGAHIDKQAAGAFLADLDFLKPKQIVRLGDHLDCGGFLAQHHPLTFLPEIAYSYEDDCAAANCFLDQTQKRAPGADDYYIMGNHEQRVEKWIIGATVRNPKDAPMLNRMFGVESVLHLEKRGIQVIKRDQAYHGLKKRGTIKLGKCLFHHGTRTGAGAAKKNLEDVGTNICFGHTHHISCCIKETADGNIGSWSFGCLSELHPLYGDTNTTDWAHGYGIHIVKDNGQFMCITVPILDGVSYLSLLTQGLK